MNQDLFERIARFSFGLKKFPEKLFNFFLKYLFDSLLPQVPPQVLGQPLTHREDATQVKLPEALSLHGEGENIRQRLSADFGEEKREGMEFCHVFQDNIAMFVEADKIILNIRTVLNITYVNNTIIGMFYRGGVPTFLCGNHLTNETSEGGQSH